MHTYYLGVLSVNDTYRLPELKCILQSYMRDLCKHRWWQKGSQYEDIVLNGLSWWCWMPLITLYIFESFRVFISNDPLRIHLLFSSFQIYSEYIFKGYSTLTFIAWAQVYAPWNTGLCNFGFSISGLFVECDPLCLYLTPASSQACANSHGFQRLQLAERAQEFQPEAKNTRWESVDKINSVLWQERNNLPFVIFTWRNVETSKEED